MSTFSASDRRNMEKKEGEHFMTPLPDTSTQTDHQSQRSDMEHKKAATELPLAPTQLSSSSALRAPALIPLDTAQTALPHTAAACPIRSIPILRRVDADDAHITRSKSGPSMDRQDLTTPAAAHEAHGVLTRGGNFNSSLSPSTVARRQSIALPPSLSLSPMASLTLRPPLPPHLALAGPSTGHTGHTNTRDGYARGAIDVPASAASSLATVVPERYRPVPLVGVTIAPAGAGGEGSGEGGGGGRGEGVMDRIQLSIDGAGSVEFPFLLRRRSSAAVLSTASVETVRPPVVIPVLEREPSLGCSEPFMGGRTEDDQDRTLTMPRPRFIEPHPQPSPSPAPQPPTSPSPSADTPEDVHPGLEVQMVDELDIELCVLCHRERARDEVVMREFELFWALDDASGARKFDQAREEGCSVGDMTAEEEMAVDAVDAAASVGIVGGVTTREGMKGDEKGHQGHTGLWLVCRDEEGCRRRVHGKR